MPLVYIVDDEPNIRRLAALALQDFGMETESFGEGRAFLAAVQRKCPDVVLLDWMMPPPDGLELCRRLRAAEETRRLPIILLTARGDELDRVLGLEMGADDYVCKPFGVKELAARVRALLRRQQLAQEPVETQAVLELGPIRLDPARRRVTKLGEEVALTQREFDLLALLLRFPGRVFSREMLLDRVWQTDFFGDTRTVDVHIRYLRLKLEDEPGRPRLILTVRGIGYCFAERSEPSEPSERPEPSEPSEPSKPSEPAALSGTAQKEA